MFRIDGAGLSQAAVIRRGTLPFRTLLAVALQRSPADEGYCRIVLELLSTAASIRTRTALWGSLADLRLSELEIGVLVSLFALEPDPGTPASLTQEIKCSQTAIAAALDRLQKRTFVRRQIDRGDRRLTLVHVTAPGRSATDAVLVEFISSASRLARHVPREAAKVCGSVCHQLNGAAPRRARRA